MSKWLRIAGLVLHVLIAGIMILAGSTKIFGLFPPEEVAKLGLSRWITVIGVGELATAILLVIPRTSSLGVLLASSFWGGAICLHMSRDTSFVPPAVLLLLTWVGAFLRQPAISSSFTNARWIETKDTVATTAIAAQTPAQSIQERRSSIGAYSE